MGALGIAILSKKYKTDRIYDLNIADLKFETIGSECKGCANNCEVLKIYKDNTLIDSFGNKCPKGAVKS